MTEQWKRMERTTWTERRGETPAHYFVHSTQDAKYWMDLIKDSVLFLLTANLHQ